MKKLLLLIAFILSFSLLSYSQSSAFSVYGGYSWVNGAIGAEYQFGSMAISGGWFPTVMPGSNERISSFSGALTYYGGNWDNSAYYATIGVATAGYREQTSYNSGVWTDDVISPMTIVMAGYKGTYKTTHCKLGFGYGWCNYGDAWTWEFTIGWTLFGNY